jgi:hypothetical protein
VGLLEAEPEKRQSEADAVARGDELLGKQDQADLPEKIQRPENRPCDEQGGEEALR